MFDFYIVTSVLNAVDTIDRTIWSIISQQGNVHIHYHVQDAGSTDGTLEKLATWQKRTQSCEALPAKISFSFASEPDNGLYDGVHRGFERLNIPDQAFMGYLNGDDVLWPGAVATVAQVSEDLPDVDWLMGWPSGLDQWGRVLFHNTGALFPRNIIAAGLADAVHYGHHHIQQESTLWRKSLYDKVGGFNTAFKLAGDWDLWRRFAKHSELVHLQRNIGAFCNRPGQLSADISAYNDEIDATIPRDARAYRMAQISKNGPALRIILANLNEQGRWCLHTKEGKMTPT